MIGPVVARVDASQICRFALGPRAPTARIEHHQISDSEQHVTAPLAWTPARYGRSRVSSQCHFYPEAYLELVRSEIPAYDRLA